MKPIALITKSLCVGLLGFANQSAAETSTRWSKVADWDIMVDKSVGNGCYMLAGYTKGTFLRVGMDNNNRNGYLMVANPAWSSLEVGKEYKLSFRFDDESPWVGNFTARDMGGLVVLVVSFEKPQLLKDFAAKQNVSISYQDKFVTTLPLTGSYAAVQAMIKCQNTMDAAAERPSDPFDLDAARRNPDPFATGGTRPASDDPFR